MNTTLLRMVRRHHQSRHAQRAWVRSIRHLGAKWLLAQPVSRKESANV